MSAPCEVISNLRYTSHRINVFVKVARPCSPTAVGFNFNVEERDAEGHYETPAICRTLTLARAAFDVAVAEKPGGWFMIRNRTRAVKRHPQGDR